MRVSAACCCRWGSEGADGSEDRAVLGLRPHLHEPVIARGELHDVRRLTAFLLQNGERLRHFEQQRTLLGIAHKALDPEHHAEAGATSHRRDVVDAR